MREVNRELYHLTVPHFWRVLALSGIMILWAINALMPVHWYLVKEIDTSERIRYGSDEPSADRAREILTAPPCVFLFLPPLLMSERS